LIFFCEFTFTPIEFYRIVPRKQRPNADSASEQGKKKRSTNRNSLCNLIFLFLILFSKINLLLNILKRFLWYMD